MRITLRTVAFTGVLALCLVSERLSAQTATQTVTFSVVSISRAAVSGLVSPLIMRPAVAGRKSTSGSVGGSTFAIATNEANQKIAASLDMPMPTGVSLAVSLAAPAGGASLGSTNLGIAAADLVTGVPAGNAALPITYLLNAKNDAPRPAGNRVVTYTIMSGL